jgi:uncharacterized protein (TIRG00374 family)
MEGCPSMSFDSSDSKARDSKRSYMQLVLGCSITMICLYVVFRKVEWRELFSAIESMSWHYIAIAWLSLTLGYFFRVARWAVMLKATGAKVTIAECAAPFVVSISLNNILPFRAGDVVRAFVFPAALGIERTTAIASLVFERLIDLATLLACFGVAIYVLPAVVLPSWLKDLSIALSIASVTGVVILTTCGRPVAAALSKLVARRPDRKLKLHWRAMSLLSVLVGSAGAMAAPRTISVVLFLSIGAWAGECGLYAALLSAMALHADVTSALLLMSVATLATLVPSSPGYVGPYHLAAFTAVGIIGGTTAQASALAIIAHMAIWLPTTLAGLVAMVTHPGLFRAIQKR